MNHTWTGLANADRAGARFDYNFLLSAELFPNGTLQDIAEHVNLEYQSFFSTSTPSDKRLRNSSFLNQTAPLDARSSITPVERFVLTFLMSTMAFLTVSGNSLVIIAFICEPAIRTYSNYFILNLSIADLLIGLIW